MALRSRSLYEGKDPVRWEMWMKSKWSCSHNQSSSVASSTRKWTFSGTSVGWTGERSVPTISASGKIDAKGVRKKRTLLKSSEGKGESHTHFHRPDPGACTDVENSFGVLQGCKEQATLVDQLEHVVLHVQTIEFLLVVGIEVGCGWLWLVPWKHYHLFLQTGDIPPS